VAVEIIPGIYQLAIPLPFNQQVHTNDYLLKGKGGCLLIDTGWNTDEAFRELSNELDDAGVRFKEIERVIVTHAHPDHYGLVNRVHEISGARIYMHYMDQEVLRTRYAISEEYARQSEDWFYTNGVPRNELPVTRPLPGGQRHGFLPRSPDIFLKGGEVFPNGPFELKIIWTPGHSPGHICIYESKNKIIFTGDHVLPTIMSNISLTPGSQANPLADFIKSLEIIRELDVTKALPAHENVFYNFKQRIDEIIEHHQTRSTEILEKLDAGVKTAYEICGLITWMPEYGGVKFEDLMPYDRRAAVSETMAHLRAMIAMTKIRVVKLNNLLYYERV
jgi:glyoxylase-like metal-dependent hydrolase (beta-lactamase superfamily II)